MSTRYMDAGAEHLAVRIILVAQRSSTYSQGSMEKFWGD